MFKYFALFGLLVFLTGCANGFRAISTVKPNLKELSVSCAPNSTISCQTPHGTGSQSCNSASIADGPCIANSCQDGYNLQRGMCVANVCNPNTPSISKECAVAHGMGSQFCNDAGSGWGFCGNAFRCDHGYNPQNGICVVNLCDPNSQLSCHGSHGGGTETCNNVGSAYGTCVLSSCDPGFNLQNGVCVANVCAPNSQQSCRVTNGTSSQTCNSVGSAWGSCGTPQSCDPGFNLQNGVCVANVCAPNSQQSCHTNNGTGSQVCDGTGSAWGACGGLQTCDSGFILQYGACVTNQPLSGDPSCQSVSCEVSYANLQVRIGRPLVIRQTANDELDGQVPFIRLANGLWRFFSSEFNAFAIDGSLPWDASGDVSGRRQVLWPGGTVFDRTVCGRWLNAVIPDPANGRLIGFIHEESEYDCTAATYNPFQSTAITFSYDEGLTWTNPYDPSRNGATILGANSTSDNLTDWGEAADCGAVRGAVNDIYLYCLRRVDSRTVVAHASMNDLSPSGWKKYYNGSFSEPGINGQASALGTAFMGNSPFYIKESGLVALSSWQVIDGGYSLNLNISSDFVTFTQNVLSGGLIYEDFGSWSRPNPQETVTYWGAFGSWQDGTNAIDLRTPFGFNYVYFAPGGGINEKNLVQQGITLDILSSPPLAQVSTQLTRWHGPSGRYRSTTGPVRDNGNVWTEEGGLGYVLTGPSPDKPTIKLEECKSNWTEEYETVQQGTCDPAWYNHYRMVGWIFQNQEAGTIPLYSCWRADLSAHFLSNQANCEGVGTGGLLGYVLP